MLFKSRGTEIPSEAIEMLWKEIFPNEPIPKIQAVNVSKEEYLGAFDQIEEEYQERGAGDLLKECVRWEYEGFGPSENSVAFALPIPEKMYLIVRRENSKFSEKSHLEPELEHISRVDFERFKKEKGWDYIPAARYLDD